MPRQEWWVKFANHPPQRYSASCFEEFWHRLRDDMLHRQLILEWVIYE